MSRTITPRLESEIAAIYTHDEVDGRVLDRIARAVQSFCRTRISRRVSRIAADEIAEKIANSVVAGVLLRSPELATPQFWTVVRHDLIDALRALEREGKRLRRYHAEIGLLNDPTTKSQEIGGGECCSRIWTALERLPARVRHAFILHRVLRYPITTKDPSKRPITELLGASEKSIRRWIKRAEKLISESPSDRRAALATLYSLNHEIDAAKGRPERSKVSCSQGPRGRRK